MTNHIMYFKKSDDFFSKCNRSGVFNQSEIGNEHAANFENKMYIKFQNIKV